MARARNIKPGFFANEDLAEVAPLGRILFAGLWTVADRDGRMEDRPKRFKAQLLPYDDCDVDGLLTALHDGGFILRYESKGSAYIQVLAWEKHQNPHMKEAASTIPAPYKNGANTGKSGTSTVLGTTFSGTSPADSLNLVSDSLNLIPDPLNPLTPPRSLRSRAVETGEAVTPTNPTASKVETGETWTAYEFAYMRRYRAEPVRNARVNSQMAKFVRLVGVAEAPSVAEFYLGHGDARYVREGHSVGMLVAHAEKLRTEWATGVRGTMTAAAQGDKLQATGDVFTKLIQEAKHESENH